MSKSGPRKIAFHQGVAGGRGSRAQRRVQMSHGLPSCGRTVEQAANITPRSHSHPSLATSARPES